MGTRATIHIYDGSTLLVSIYKQYDGHPSSLGVRLARFILSGRFVNDIPEGDDRGERFFNGAGCFAARLIAELKGVQPGDIYITNQGNRQEFNYDIYCPTTQQIDGGYPKPAIICRSDESVTEGMDASDFLVWCRADTDEGDGPFYELIDPSKSNNNEDQPGTKPKQASNAITQDPQPIRLRASNAVKLPDK